MRSGVEFFLGDEARIRILLVIEVPNLLVLCGVARVLLGETLSSDLDACMDREAFNCEGLAVCSVVQKRNVGRRYEKAVRCQLYMPVSLLYSTYDYGLTRLFK